MLDVSIDRTDPMVARLTPLVATGRDLLGASLWRQDVRLAGDTAAAEQLAAAAAAQALELDALAAARDLSCGLAAVATRIAAWAHDLAHGCLAGMDAALMDRLFQHEVAVDQQLDRLAGRAWARGF